MAWVGPARGSLRPGVPGRVVAVVGAMVRYADTPVGSYSEVLGALALWRPAPGLPLAGHVPFIAVDSAASVAGGRANWALPKVLARFDHRDGTATAEPPGWRVTVRARPLGPAVRLPVRFALVQTRSGRPGRARATGTVRLRAALVRVRVDGPGASGRTLLRPGAVVTDAELTLGPLREP